MESRRHRRREEQHDQREGSSTSSMQIRRPLGDLAGLVGEVIAQRPRRSNTMRGMKALIVEARSAHATVSRRRRHDLDAQGQPVSTVPGS
jgi:hypothetical protein